LSFKCAIFAQSYQALQYFTIIRRFLPLIFTLLSLVFIACKPGIHVQRKYLLAKGVWRGSMPTVGGPELPFLFRIEADKDTIFRFVMNAGSEEILSRNVQVIDDSIIIELPQYESMIIAGISATGDSLQGRFIKTKYDVSTSYKFSAVYGQKYTFKANGKANIRDFSGYYDAKFYAKNDSMFENAVGYLHQDGIEIYGSFVTKHGDFRQMTGIVDGDSAFLGGFDGSFANLFCLKKSTKGFIGRRYTAYSLGGKIEAVLNPSTKLMDLDHVVSANVDSKIKVPLAVANTFLDLEDPEYKGKLVILQILGTWCPNCTDEARMLVEFDQKYRSRGLKIVGLAFERTAMLEKAANLIEVMRKRLGIEYPVFHAGTPKAEESSRKLAFIKGFETYPTTVFVSPEGKIIRIHNGFSGPGTGPLYETEKKNFEEFILQHLPKNQN
jgi:thiol-disulfide isomerase/thioredoxin